VIDLSLTMMYWTLFLLLIIAALGLTVWLQHRRGRVLSESQEELRRQRQATVDLLDRIGLSINASLDLDGALETITEYIVESTNAEAGAIYLLDPGGRFLHARTVVGLFPPMHQTSDYVLTKRRYLSERIKHETIEMGEGIIGFVARTGEALLISDALADPRVSSTATDFLQIESMMMAPLKIRQRTVGVFAVVNKRGREIFGHADLRLLEQLSIQAALTVDIVRLYEHQAEQRRIEQELQLAQEFQKMLLPHSLPEAPGLDLAAFSQPAREVGGDYYDLFWVEPGRLLGIAIMDVAGKSIPGALVMAVVRSALKAEAAGRTSPREVLRRVNRHMRADTTESVFVTASYAILNLESRRITFVRAGHEPMVLCRARRGDCEVCSPAGIALGLVDDAIFDVLEEAERQLESQDVVVFYTDGVIEATNDQEAEYGMERFLKSLQIRLNQPAQAQVDGILEDIGGFTGGVVQHDDITMVVLRVLEG